MRHILADSFRAMRIIEIPRRAVLLALPSGRALVLLSACASQDTVATPVDPGPTQPRTASYSCSDGGLVRIQNLGASIRILDPESDALELPASPPSQRNRYGETGNAVVLDGKDALIMRSGQTPLACTR
jgi:hypothetical protein